MNSRTEHFLDLYRQLESLVSATYGLDETQSAVSWLLRKPQWRNIRESLEYCRDVRNLLSHNPKLGGSYAVEPSEEMVALLEKLLLDIREPKRAVDVCIPRERVLCRSLNDRVLPTLKVMDQRMYTSIPILKNGTVIGAFSENTLLRLLLDRGALAVSSELTFGQIEAYLPLEQHRTESYRFVAEDTPLSLLEELFADALKQRDRIGLVFVTKTGAPEEKLLGILSPWHVAAID